MKRVRDINSLKEVETDLDRCLSELRATPRSNFIATGAIEYRIAQLRARKVDLQ